MIEYINLDVRVDDDAVPAEVRAVFDGLAWNIFLTTFDSGLWFCVYETMERPHATLDYSGDRLYIKLPLLLGCQWEEIEDDLGNVLEFQTRALEGMSLNWQAKLIAAAPENVKDFREEMESIMPVMDGEHLIERLTGIDVRAQRN